MFEVLTCEGRDAAKWQSLLEQLPYDKRDVHFTPAYGRVQQRSGQGRVCAAVGQWGSEFIIQPFMLREGKYRDVTSLFGGSGAVTNTWHGNCWDDFNRQMVKWANANSVLCEFTQLNPHAYAAKPGKGDKETVLVDIDMDDAALLSSFSRNRQRGVRGDVRAGHEVVQSAMNDADLTQFSKLYLLNLGRLDAAAYWYYPAAVWAAYRSEMAPEYASLLVLMQRGEAASMLFTVHGYGKAYAHFLGGPSSDLLYFASMKLARDMGCKTYNLGGGLTASPQDSLLAYKAGFSTQRLPIRTYKRIFDQAGYDAACAGTPATSFFPAYRSPSANSSQASSPV